MAEAASGSACGTAAEETTEDVVARCVPITSSASASSVISAVQQRSLVPYGSPKHSWSDYRGGKYPQASRQHPLLPVAAATQYSDSGFGSTLSSGSSCSYLPPPPPYRMNVRRQQNRIHRSLSDSKYGSGGQRGALDSFQVSRHSWGFSRSPSPSMSTVSCPEYGELQDKLQRLEVDRESLSLQVSVLTEQVGAQTEKIKDLESLLEVKRQKLDSTEDMLQEELGARTTLETSKLDLMAQISSLRLKLAELEREKIDTESKLRSSKVEIDHLHKQMKSQDYAKSTANQKSGTMDQSEINHLVQKLRLRSKEAAGEIEQLRSAVQQLMVANVEKEEEIEKLKGVVVAQARNASYATAGWDEAVGVPRSASAYAAMGNGNVPPEFDINQQLRRLLSEEVSGRGNYPLYPATTYSSYTTGPSVQSSSSYNSSLSGLSTGSPLTWSGPATPRHQQFLPQMPAAATRPPLSSLAARQLAAELDELAPNFRRLPQTTSTSGYYTGSLPRSVITANAADGSNGRMFNNARKM